MNFLPHLAQLVMAGKKTVTRRIASSNPRSVWSTAGCKLRVGRDYAVCPGRGKPAIGRARVLDLALMPLGRLSPGEARREGFDSVTAFETAFTRIHGCYNPQTLVWRVQLQPADQHNARQEARREEAPGMTEVIARTYEVQIQHSRDGAWIWCTEHIIRDTAGPGTARRKADRLHAGGIRARVVDTATGEVIYLPSSTRS
jgi:hypothetical protein